MRFNQIKKHKTESITKAELKTVRPFLDRESNIS